MKRAISILFVLVFVMQLVSPVSISLNPNISKGETLIARIYGNFESSPTSQNVFFYKNHVRIPFDFKFERVSSNEYYLYTQTNEKSEGNYTLSIERVSYLDSLGNLISDPISKNFSISESIADFSVSPAFFKTPDSFEISLKNLKENSLTISYGSGSSSTTSGESTLLNFLFGDNSGSNLSSSSKIKFSSPDSNIVLSPFETKTVSFTASPASKDTLSFLTLSSGNTTYAVPVYVLKFLPQELENTTPKNISYNIEFDPVKLTITLDSLSQIDKTIYLKNIGNTSSPEINITIPDTLKRFIFLSEDSISSLDSGEQKRLNLRINPNNAEGSVDGKIIAYAGEDTAKLEIEIIFSHGQKYSEENVSLNESLGNIPIGRMLCSEANGTFCNERESCNGTQEWTRDGKCCFGSCIKESKSSYGKIIGWLTLFVLIIIIVWFIKSKFMKKKRKEIDLEKIAKPKK